MLEIYEELIKNRYNELTVEQKIKLYLKLSAMLKKQYEALVESVNEEKEAIAEKSVQSIVDSLRQACENRGKTRKARKTNDQ